MIRGIGGSTLRGGQTVFHGIRMWGQLFQAALLFAAFMTVAVPAWNLWHSTSGAEWYAAGMATLAETKLALGYERDSGQEIRFPDGRGACSPSATSPSRCRLSRRARSSWRNCWPAPGSASRPAAD